MPIDTRDTLYDFVRISEVRSKVLPKTKWYIPRDYVEWQWIEMIIAIGYVFIDMKGMGLNQVKEVLEKKKDKKKVILVSYMDYTGSMLAANFAVELGYETVIEFHEQMHEVSK